MTALPPITLPRIEIEPEAQAYAEEKGAGAEFRHLLQAVPRLFPTFQRLRVVLEPDAEMADYFFVVWEVTVPPEDYRPSRDIWTAWHEEIMKANPGFSWVSFPLYVEKAE